MLKHFFGIIWLILLSPCLLFASLEVHFVNVGQGDAIVINADGHFGVIDGGPKGSSSTLYSYLKSLNPSPLEFIAITHTDLDHIGGIGSVIEAAGISPNCTVWTSENLSGNRQIQSFTSKVTQAGCKITIPVLGQQFRLGKAIITVIGPVTKLNNKNSDCLVLRLEYKGKSFLFMGDADWQSENRMANKYGSVPDFGVYQSSTLKADVIKVGHHGSRDSTTQYFLHFVRPQYAIISVGAVNRYGHPDQDTLSRLVQSDSQIYRTDYHGHIKVTVSDGIAGGTLSIFSQKNNGKSWMDESLLPSYMRNDNR